MVVKALMDDQFELDVQRFLISVEEMLVDDLHDAIDPAVELSTTRAKPVSPTYNLEWDFLTAPRFRRILSPSAANGTTNFEDKDRCQCDDKELSTCA